jgi:hypothetical protein
MRDFAKIFTLIYSNLNDNHILLFKPIVFCHYCTWFIIIIILKCMKALVDMKLKQCFCSAAAHTESATLWLAGCVCWHAVPPSRCSDLPPCAVFGQQNGGRIPYHQAQCRALQWPARLVRITLCNLNLSLEFINKFIFEIKTNKQLWLNIFINLDQRRSCSSPLNTC